MGWAVAQQGESATWLAQMHQGIAGWRAAGSEVLVPYAPALLAETDGHTSQLEAGLTAFAEALAVLEQTGECWYEAELHRLRGELLLAGGGSEENVATHLQCALAIARQQQAKSLELRATMSLCRLWQQQSKRAEAQQRLAATYGWFTEEFAMLDLIEAKVLLAALAGRQVEDV